MPVVGSSVNKLLLQLQFALFLHNHDVVFFEWAGPLLVRATQMPRRCRIAVRLHSIDVVLWAHLVDWSQVDETVVVSQHMKHRLQDIAKSTPTRLHVINNGVDLDRFRPVQRDFGHRIGMAGAIIPIKRIYEAVLCLAELRRQGHPFVLHIAGRSDQEQTPRYGLAVASLIEKLGLAESVFFYGYVEDMPQWYQSIDVFLSNSYWEGQPLALLEAMASGCHCLGHSWGGAEEVLPLENIFVTDKELQERLVYYANQDEDRRRKMQEDMRFVAKTDFDEQRMIYEVLSVIETVVGF
jgi:glycosyltransferase involved in cell wall biosynthesis